MDKKSRLIAILAKCSFALKSIRAMRELIPATDPAGQEMVDELYDHAQRVYQRFLQR